MSDLAREIRRRASDRCEYCRLPQSAFRRLFHIEHIVARQHGGLSVPGNLSLACWSCNLKDDWHEHFTTVIGESIPLGIAMHELTRTGRATVRVLGLNDDMRQLIRYELRTEGLYSVGDVWPFKPI